MNSFKEDATNSFYRERLTLVETLSSKFASETTFIDIEVKKYNNKIADRGVKVAAMKMGYGVRGKTYKAGQKIKGATGFVKSKSDKVKNKVGEFMNTGTGQFLKRHVSNSAGIAAAVMGASMTYGASDKTSLFEAGIAGYGVYGGVKNGVMNLMNRKNDNYIEQSTQYAKMLCKVEGDDPDKMTNEDMVRKMKMATVNDKNGDYKKISDKRKDAKEDVAKQLEARDRANGMSEEDIADKVAQKEYIKTADKAMEDIEPMNDIVLNYDKDEYMTITIDEGDNNIVVD